MTLPPLPEEFELNWFGKRNAFDIAVRDFIETGGGSVDAEAVRDIVGAALVAGSGVTVTVNDGADTITISAAGIDAEAVRDTIGAALVAGTGVTITVNDAADTITITLANHSAALITSGNLDVARNTASIPHDVWQASGGTWPSRPTVPTGARVNWIGYPGLTDLPAGFTSGTDSYMMRTA